MASFTSSKLSAETKQVRVFLLALRVECFILKRLLCLSMSLALVNKENIFICIYDDDELMMLWEV